MPPPQKQPLRDPDRLRQLLAVLQRQLETHRASPDRSMTWVLEEARILDNIIMAQMQLENILRGSE